MHFLNEIIKENGLIVEANLVHHANPAQFAHFREKKYFSEYTESVEERETKRRTQKRIMRNRKI